MTKLEPIGLPSRMTSAVRQWIRRNRKIHMNRKLYRPSDRKVRNEVGRVIFFALSRERFDGPGKGQPKIFFPPFCEVLAEKGLSSYFVDSPERVIRLNSSNSCIVYIYGEDTLRFNLDNLKFFTEKNIVFNDPRIGELIADKQKTNLLLKKSGVPVPELYEFTSEETPIFSNSVKGSGVSTYVVLDKEVVDGSRYNTELIDTTITFEGRAYYTCVRLMCVADKLLHAYVRARDVEEGSPSVHAKNTPLSPKLVEHLQDRLVRNNIDRLTEICRNIFQALGPGFYSHDVLIEESSDRILVCETGYKFNDNFYTDRLQSIQDKIPSHSVLFSSEFARRSAIAFVDTCQHLGLRTAV